MSQHDLDIANQTASQTRVDLNLAFKSLGSTSSGPSEPTTSYPNQLWYDTDQHILKMKAEVGADWISIGYLDQSADAFRVLDDTQVVSTSGTQTGLLGDQATTTWETGTGTTESLVSPAKVKAAIESLLVTGYDTSHDGYLELFMGFKLVWGVFQSVSETAQSVTFHESFSNNCWGVTPGGFDQVTGGATGSIYSVTKTGFIFDRNNTAVDGTPNMNYFAWGN